MKTKANMTSFTGGNPGRTYKDVSVKVKNNNLTGRSVVKTKKTISDFKVGNTGTAYFNPKGSSVTKTKKVYKNGVLVKTKTK